MIKRLYPSPLFIGLVLALGFSVVARGASLRIFWLPVSTLIGFIFAGFLISRNHLKLPFRPNSKTDLPLLAFLGWAVLSFFGSINQEQTFFEVLRLSTLVMVYFLVAYALPEEPDKKMLAFVVVGLGFFEAVYGLFGFTTGTRLFDLSWVNLPPPSSYLTGTYGNHNHFAGLMEMCIFLGFGMIVAVRRKKGDRSEQNAQRILLTIPCGIMILALVLCLSRGGWASFLAAVPLFLLLFWWHRHPLWSRVLVLALLVILLVGAFIMKVNRDPLVQRLETLESFYHQPEEISTNVRISIWKSSLAMIREHPWNGTGWGTFRSAFPSYRRDYLFYGPVFAHNDYLQIAAGMGLPGLGLFLLFILMIFGEGLRVIRSRAEDFWALAMPGVLAGMVAVLIHEIVDFNLMIPANAMIFFSLAGLVARRARELS